MASGPLKPGRGGKHQRNRNIPSLGVANFSILSIGSRKRNVEGEMTQAR